MARLDGESSNDLFDTLSEWERYLRAVESLNTVTQDNDPGCGDEHYGT
ncbi:MAG: hypothetical protein ACU0AT_11260 [Tranquillimonas sp.]